MTPAAPPSCARCGIFVPVADRLCEPCGARQAALLELGAQVRRLAHRAAAAGALSALVYGALALKVSLGNPGAGMLGFALANVLPLGLWSALVFFLRRSWPTVFFFAWLVLVGVPGSVVLLFFVDDVSPRALVVAAVAHLLQAFSLVQLLRLWRANRALAAAPGAGAAGE